MRKFLYFLPAAVYYALIFYLSQRSYDFEVGVPHFDKGAHFLEFTVLAVLLFFGYFKSIGADLKIKAFFTFITATLLAIADEIHHYFVPGRESDILDVIADVGGIIFGLFLFWYFSRRIRLKIFNNKSKRDT
jgi:VanZ family protein